MKILILGHARHGKDTVAEILSSLLGLPFESSSMFMLKKIKPDLEQTLGIQYSSLEEAYEDRVNHRQLWKELISDYCSTDKGRLARELLEGNDIYAGMRCNQEYQASKHMFDLILWVDASPRLKANDPTMGIDYNYLEMYTVDNSGGRSKLLKNLAETVQMIENLNEEVAF